MIKTKEHEHEWTEGVTGTGFRAQPMALARSKWTVIWTLSKEFVPTIIIAWTESWTGALLHCNSWILSLMLITQIIELEQS